MKANHRQPFSSSAELSEHHSRASCPQNSAHPRSLAPDSSSIPPNPGLVLEWLLLALAAVAAPESEPLAVAVAEGVPVAAGVVPGVSIAVPRAEEAPVAPIEPPGAVAVPRAEDAPVAVQAAVAVAVPAAIEAAGAVEAPVAPVAAGAPAVVASVAIEAPVVAVIVTLALEESHLWEVEVKSTTGREGRVVNTPRSSSNLRAQNLPHRSRENQSRGKMMTSAPPYAPFV